MGENFNNEEVAIDLKTLMLELISHWKKILIFIVLLAAIAFAYSKVLVTPMYTSTAKLYVLSSSTSITSLADIQIGSNLTNDYMEVVKGRPVVEQVISNLGLKEDYNSLESRLILNNPDSSRILEITVKDADPQTAKLIADEFAEVSAAFISDKMHQDPPTIVQYGYVAEDPFSPDILKNTILGGAIGAILSIIILSISFIYNDTIMTPEDIESRIGLNVLAAIPKDEAEYNGVKKSSKKNKKRKEPMKTTSANGKKSKQR